LNLILLIVAGLLVATSLGTSVPGLLFLFIATHIFCYSTHLALGFSGAIALGLLVVAFPLVSILAGALLDKFCALGPNRTNLQSISVCLTMALIFQSNAFIGYFEEALRIAQEPSSLKLTAFVVSILNTIIFCGGLIAFSSILLAALFEFPFNWINSAATIRIIVPSAALRQLLVIMTLSIVISFAIGLCIAELRPTVIFASSHWGP
jgi:hypothetical protein